MLIWSQLAVEASINYKYTSNFTTFDCVNLDLKNPALCCKLWWTAHLPTSCRAAIICNYAESFFQLLYQVYLTSRCFSKHQVSSVPCWLGSCCSAEARLVRWSNTECSSESHMFTFYASLFFFIYRRCWIFGLDLWNSLLLI